ncbi:hypothetical protein JD844_011140 [Phrynosoma platyrhinos]|uniref:START domain-containing protein n=1 Tax=Phrynosoma platyrhinos TaxID=52577 RepID=A0ABQ7THV7_PHRPL|nr:hypothetical protein JD844_011140 [Phrynosoma platyrhinos]
MCPPEALRDLLLRRRPELLLWARAAAAAGEGGGRGRSSRRLLAWAVVVMSNRGSNAGPSASASTSARQPQPPPPPPQAPPRGAFPEAEFVAVCRELARSSKAPAEASWQLMADSLGFSIYRLRDEKSGLYEYKIYGTLDDCSPELCADVYMDLNYRINWDQFLKELCEKTQDGRTVIYWEVKFPFPLANRDVSFQVLECYFQHLWLPALMQVLIVHSTFGKFKHALYICINTHFGSMIYNIFKILISSSTSSQYVFIRERQDIEVDGKKIYVVLAKSVNSSKFPEKPGIVRVKNYRQSVAFQSDGKKGSKDSVEEKCIGCCMFSLLPILHGGKEDGIG